MDRSNPAWTVPSNQEGSALRSFLKLQLGRSNREVGRLLDGGKVVVNGRREQFGSRRLKRGDQVALTAKLEISTQNEPTSLDILHEDEELLVINKAAGLPSQRTRDPKRITCEGLVDEAYRAKGLEAPVLVHRLDRDTSGLLLFAKGENMATRLMDWFRQRQVKKTYLAICEGAPPLKEGTWSHHLGPGGKRGGKTFHAVCHSGGQKAITEYRVMASGSGLSLWELKPHTGRTHQLRVQCSAARHPIVGDHLYGAPKSPGRHLLHAAQLTLPEEAGNITRFQAPLHPDFDSKLRSIGALGIYQNWSLGLNP